MTRRILSILCATVLLVGSGYAATKLLENIPLVWKPTDTLGSLGSLDLAAPVISTPLHSDALVDTRNNPALIGRIRKAPTSPFPSPLRATSRHSLPTT